MKIAREVVGHMLTSKALKYRLGAFIWAMVCSFLFYGTPFGKSLAMLATFMGGKMVWYGIHEYIEHRNKVCPHCWRKP